MTVLTLAVISQDRYDTLILRGNRQIYIPRWDTIKELNEINNKADTIMCDLRLIKEKLGIKDTIK